MEERFQYFSKLVGWLCARNSPVYYISGDSTRIAISMGFSGLKSVFAVLDA
jgi:hypothetical protein